MKHHPRALLPLLAAALSCAPAPPGRACDAASLQALDLSFGEVLSREPLPARVEQPIEIEKRRVEASCVVEESDDACIERLTAAHASILAEGQRLTVTLEGPFDHVRAVFEVGGERRSVLLPSYAAAATYMEAQSQSHPDIALISAQQTIDPAKRTAVVRAVEDGVETVELGVGARIIVRMSTSPLEALRVTNALEDVTVTRWMNEADGTAILDFRCRE